MNRIQSSFVSSLALLCLVTGSAAEAGPINSWGSAVVDVQVGDYFELASRGIESEAQLAYDDQFGHSAQARAYSDYGLNHVYVANTNADVGSTPVFAEALSLWNERFLVSGGTGLGRAKIKVRLSGEISSTGLNDIDPLLSYGLLYQPEAGSTHSQMAIAWSSDSELTDGLGVIAARDLAGEFVFEYDQPFILYATLRANVAGNGIVDAFHSAQVTNTVFPRGALVINDGGEPVRAALHFNAVPEPTSLALMFAALIFMTWQAGRQTSRRGIARFLPDEQGRLKAAQAAPTRA